MTGRSLELYLYPLDKKETPIGEHAIRDLYIAKNQEVTGAACDVYGTIESALDIGGTGMKRMGWVHSHGNLNTFFSPKYHDNMRISLDTSPIDMDSTSLDSQLRSRVHYHNRLPHYEKRPRVDSRRYERAAF